MFLNSTDTGLGACGSTEPSVSLGVSLGIFNGTLAGNGAPALEPPIPAELVDSFAAATGWVIGFEESHRSLLFRARTQTRQPTGGILKIVDMSQHWPAQTPTVHRGHCDRVVQSWNEMIQPQLKRNATRPSP